VARPFIRILSDLHYGDRASVVRDLNQLNPLLAGPQSVILNGDTLDTRPGPHAAITAQTRETVLDFIRRSPVPLTCLTGNHDPDLTTDHLRDLADGAVLVTHGDIAFADIVPWGQDASLARQLVMQERSHLPATASFEQLLAAHRRACAVIPQRHQSEPRSLKYLASYLADTVWPPTRIPRILRAWAEMSARISAVAATHRPRARFILNGHTHRAGIWRRPDGRVIINTGSYCPPSGCQLVDISGDHLTVRRVERRAGEFHAGATVAEFALARG
jgi:predicted phosphodiesterase